MIRCVSLSLILVAAVMPNDLCAQPPPPLAQLKAAAEAGDPVAQDKLAGEYRSRLDSKNAQLWYRKAAESGIPNSQSQLAQLLMHRSRDLLSNLTSKERADMAQESIHWYLKAANQEDKRAQIDLGRQFQSGKNVKQDYPEAYKWFALANREPQNPFDSLQHESKWALDAIILKCRRSRSPKGRSASPVSLPAS
jgi:hypothetical protein